MPSSPTVLVVTCSEYGQANVHLATSYELALSGVNVCIASFAPLETRVLRLQERVRHDSSSDSKHTGSISFHELKGITPHWEAMAKAGVTNAKFAHSHGVWGAPQCYSTVSDTSIFPWSPEEHLMAMGRVTEAVATTKPNIVVIDPLFLPAIDACKLAGHKFVVLFPNSVKDVVARKQPNFARYWKYPALASGFPFPLKWWQIPLNLYLYARLIIHSMASVTIKRIQTMRRSLGITAYFGYEMYRGVTYISPGLPETDFSLAVIPEEIVMCGPIISPFDALEESDPVLKKWLDNGPTVMVNLGSHAVSDEKFAREMASSFRMLLDYHDRKGVRNMQVLWKVRENGDIQTAIDQVIGKEVREERVKVVAWLNADPVAILQHPNVVCTVHHGGANSFYEGIWAGLPHVVLPVWLDTFDYAARVEFLNIGIFGSKSSAPGVRVKEFGKALVSVTGDSEEGRKFRSMAIRLKGVCLAKGSGRKLASMAILKEIGATK